VTPIAVGLLGLVFVFLIPAIFMWLWNITCPEAFHWPELRYWQAFRLLILASLLLGVTRLFIGGLPGTTIPL
jgi:uncharacterized oligopeptide transporter (OPT) family protein